MSPCDLAGTAWDTNDDRNTVGTSPPGEFHISCRLKRLLKTSPVIWILRRIWAHGFIFNSPVFLQRSNLQKEGNCRPWRGDWWSRFFLWPLNDVLPQDTKWYQWFLTGVLSLVQCICDRVLQVFGIEHSSSCLGSQKKSREDGQQASCGCSCAACQPLLESCGCQSRWDGEMWEGKYELMEGLPLLQKQTRASFHKWARWLCLNGAETRVGSGRSAKVRCGHLKQQQLIHLGGVTELEQNMILSLIIICLICVFGFPVKGARSLSQMMYWRKSSDRKLYSCYYVCPQSFHYMSVSIISTMNLQSLYTFPHDGVNCNFCRCTVGADAQGKQEKKNS